MPIERTKGLTVLEQISRNAAFRGRALAVRVIDPATGYILKAAQLFGVATELRGAIHPANIEVRTPLGLPMESAVIRLTPEEIDAKAAEMDALSEIANYRPAKYCNPPQTVRLTAQLKAGGSYTYEIGKYPVTVAQYREFYEATGHGMKILGEHGADKQALQLARFSKDDHPMVYVNHRDRCSYLAWLRQQTGNKYDLPISDEMEFAMGGQQRRIYPWGDEWQKPPYYRKSVTAPVDSFPQGATPEGIAGFGIVWEATRTVFEGVSRGVLYVLHGGSAWVRHERNFSGAEPTIEYFLSPRKFCVGFRVAKNL
jgi:hypothetical protein